MIEEYIKQYDHIIRQLVKLGDGIQFNEADHKYLIDNKQFISVTTILGLYENEFDKTYWANRKSDELGVPVESILERWQKTNDISKARGTQIHRYLECLFRGYPLPELPISHSEPLNRLVENLRKTYTPLKSEMKIADRENGICGTLDQILLNRNTGKLSIFDWKTNKKISNKGFGKLKYELSDLDDCELNNYSLQIGLYENIIRRYTDLEFEQNYIVHIDHSANIKFYKTLDMSDKVEQIIRSKRWESLR